MFSKDMDGKSGRKTHTMVNARLEDDLATQLHSLTVFRIGLEDNVIKMDSSIITAYDHSEI